MKNSTFDVLKFLAQIVLPALATLVLTLGGIWNMPYAEQISATIVAIDTFLGAVLMISTSKYNKAKESDD